MTVTVEEPPGTCIDFRWPQTPEEFDAAVEALQHGLVHFAYCRLGGREEAEDAVQDVLVRAYADRAKHRHVTRFTAYVYRMLINRCADLLRRRRWSSGAPVPDNPAPDDPFGDAVAGVERRRVRVLLERIPAKEADVVRLRLWAGMTFDEIARVQEAPLPTVKSRYRYALNRLRGLIEEGEAR